MISLVIKYRFSGIKGQRANAAFNFGTVSRGVSHRFVVVNHSCASITRSPLSTEHVRFHTQYFSLTVSKLKSQWLKNHHCTGEGENWGLSLRPLSTLYFPSSQIKSKIFSWIIRH